MWNRSFVVTCFKLVGKSTENLESDDPRAFATWCLGVCLLTHCISFISVPYFDQIIVFWYWLLAALAFLALPLPEDELELESAEV